MQNDFNNLYKTIGYTFKNEAIIKNAFIHRSYLNESDDKSITSNERLEFLGDAILQFICSKYLFNKYPYLAEGELTNLRSKVVNTESLSKESKRLKLYDFLYISKGEKDIAAESSYILANVFEAVLGAIYLDSSLTDCENYLEKNLFYKIEEILTHGTLKDPKSLYQELSQEKYNVTPTYEVIDETGPDHVKEFTVGLFLSGKLISKGKGSSKRKAQQEAAENALEEESSRINKWYSARFFAKLKMTWNREHISLSPSF